MKKIFTIVLFLIFSVALLGIFVRNSWAVLGSLPTGTFTSSEWTKIDPGANKFEISNSRLVTKTGTLGWNAAMISQKKVANQAGQQLYMVLKTGTQLTYTMIGFANDQTTDANYTRLAHALYFSNGTLAVYQNGTYLGTFGTGYAPDTIYEAVITINDAKTATYKIKGGTYQNWTTLYTGPATADANFRMGVAHYQGDLTVASISDTVPNQTVDPNHPESENLMTVPLTGTADLCQATTISSPTLGDDEYLTITSTAKTGDIVAFGYAFYNLDNLDSAGKPKPIMFTNVPYSTGRTISIAAKSMTVNVNFSDVNFPDKNWNNYMPKPKNIRVDAYFKNVAGTWSQLDTDCQVKFKSGSVDPTPTPNAACVCSTGDVCATACFFDKFSTGVTYSSPIKCALGAEIFSSAPTATNKNKWCQSYLRPKGDSNNDGKVNMLDYYYYVSATSFGAKLPPMANIDFNGDGLVSSADKAILMKSLKP